MAKLLDRPSICGSWVGQLPGELGSDTHRFGTSLVRIVIVEMSEHICGVKNPTSVGQRGDIDVIAHLIAPHN